MRIEIIETTSAALFKQSQSLEWDQEIIEGMTFSNQFVPVCVGESLDLLNESNLSAIMDVVFNANEHNIDFLLIRFTGDPADLLKHPMPFKE